MRYLLLASDPEKIWGINPFDHEDLKQLPNVKLNLPESEYNLEIVEDEYGYYDRKIFIETDNSLGQLVMDFVSVYGPVIISPPKGENEWINSDGCMVIEIYNGYRE